MLSALLIMAGVAIVLGGLGLSQTGTQRAIRELPGEVTLAFAASGNSLLSVVAQLALSLGVAAAAALLLGAVLYAVMVWRWPLRAR